MRAVLVIAAIVVLADPNINYAEGRSVSRPALSFSKTRLKKGETLEITCTVADTVQEDIIQIVKSMWITDHPAGDPNAKAEVNHIMSNNTDMDPDLVSNERYSITGGPDSGGYKVKITIKDAEPMDSGVFLCTAIFADGDSVQKLSTNEQSVFVTGPIRMVKINSPPVRPEFNHVYSREAKETDAPLSADESPLSLVSGNEVEIECQVILDHKPEFPIVHVLIGQQEVRDLQRSKVNDIVERTYPGFLADAFINIYYYWKMTPSAKDHGKNVSCQARLPNMWTENVVTQRSLIIMDAPPEDGKCNPDYVHAPKGTLNVNLTCTVLATEVPELTVSWFGPGDVGKIADGQENFVKTIRRDGTLVTTSLNIANITHLGKYRVEWSNANGTIDAEVEIGDKPTKTGSGTTPWKADFAILMLSLTMAILC